MIPLNTICCATLKPIKIKPLFIIPITSAPISDQITVPFPPKRAVPPITVAAMTESTKPSPIV